MTLVTVYRGVNSAFQAAQTNEQFGVELFGVNYSHLESSYYVQLTPFSIFVILVIVTAIIKIKIRKRSVH
jgi:hypothetical protein